MAGDIFKAVKEAITIKEVVEAYYRPLTRNNHVICPFHPDKKPSLSVDDVKYKIWKCFGCDAWGDVTDFVALYTNKSLLDAALELALKYHVEYDKEDFAKKKKICDYVLRCIQNIGKTDYFSKRGLTDKTIKDFGLGYDVKKEQVVIPYNRAYTYYQTRSINSKAYYKMKLEEGGNEPLFNSRRIGQSTEDPLYIVESPICAISIEQCGGYAIALGGVGQYKKAVESIKTHNFERCVVICLDNDEEGRKASKKLLEALQAANIRCLEYNIADECKDPNELLIADSSKLQRNVDISKRIAKRKGTPDEYMISSFEISQEDVPPIEYVVDKLLPVGLTILSSAPKAGKSFMALQLCFAVARGENFLNYKAEKAEVFYYALEDNKSRLAHRQNYYLNGKEGLNEIHYLLKTKRIDTGLLDQMEYQMNKYPNTKIIIIDTFQFIRKENSQEKNVYREDYDDMTILKDFADKHQIAILLVHHFRKEADSPTMSKLSGSTGITGGADTIWTIERSYAIDSLSEAVFKVTGRDSQPISLSLRFDDKTCRWVNEGTQNDVQKTKQKQSYESNVYIRAIKSLLDNSPDKKWSGTAAQVKEQAEKLFGKPIKEDTRVIGKQITHYEKNLLEDGIAHKIVRNSARIHQFWKQQ